VCRTTNIRQWLRWTLLACALAWFGTAGEARADSGASPVLFSEILYLPGEGLPFPLAQWVELHNAGDQPVSLAQASLAVHSVYGMLSVQLPVFDAPIVPPGGFVVLGGTRALAVNGGVPVDFGYGLSFELPLTGGVLRLLLADGRFDEVVYGPAFQMATSAGTSLNLEPKGMTSAANDAIVRWCPTVISFGIDPVLFATPGDSGHECDSDGDGFLESEGDCDDDNPLMAPGLPEVCNGIDDNCDGNVDEEPLLDRPVWNTLGVCAEGGPRCSGVEGWQWTIPPGYELEEHSCDGLDNDCDGETDEGLLNLCGLCGPDEQDLCDGIDNNCDGRTDEDALLPPPHLECFSQGTGVCRDTLKVCAEGTWICVPPTTFQPNESCCDGLDNDCDGVTDEGFPVGDWCFMGKGACRSEGGFRCNQAGTGVECDAPVIPPAVEICGDNVDNDCNGLTDDGYPVGLTCSVTVGACRIIGKYLCSEDGLSVVCAVSPLGDPVEICGNGRDDDCDGEIDEADCRSDDVSGEGCGISPRRSSRQVGWWILLLTSLWVWVSIRLKQRRKSS
jgi:hypothetical protein